MADLQFDTGPSMQVEQFQGCFTTRIPHFLIKDGKRLFLAYEVIPGDAKVLANGVPNLSMQLHRETVKNIERYKAQLRDNEGCYITTYGTHDSIVELFLWARQNRFTFEVHGKLLSELRIPGLEPVTCFHGTFVEYAAAFDYHIYDKGILKYIKNQLESMPQKHLE